MKFFIFFFVLNTFLFSASIDRKIQSEKYKLTKTQKSKKLFSKSLKSIAKDVIQTNKKLLKVKKDIKNLDKQIKDQKLLEIKKSKELKKVKSTVLSLSSVQSTIQKDIASIIVKELSFDIIQSSTSKTIDSFISKDIIDILSSNYNKNIQNLQNKFSSITAKIKKSKVSLKKLQTYINTLTKKRKNLLSLKKKHTYLVNNLYSKKRTYKRKVNSVRAQEKLLKKTLAKLKILKSKELKADNIDKQRITKKLSNTNVRQVNNSYKRSIVRTYAGKKARAPLKSYSIKRKFGKYYDPIYKLTTFNDSILMHSLVPNAKVRTMFAGKVIFQHYTKILKNIVVVQSRQGINVIYANMSQIAPTIKVGSRVKQNYAIGRTKQDLSLSVTQHNKYVNPLKVFR